MKTKARKIGFILTLILILIFSLSSQAASKKQKALKTYKKMLSKSKIMVTPKQYDDGEVIYKGTKAANVKFALIYLDNDNIPELFVTAKATPFVFQTDIWGIFTYKNGKVKRIGYSQLRYSGNPKNLGYYKKSGVYKTVTDVEGCAKVFDYMQFNGSKVRMAANYQYDYYGSRKMNFSYSDGAYKTFSKSQFNAYIKKITKGRKLLKPKLYQNSAANRKKYLH